MATRHLICVANFFDYPLNLTNTENADDDTWLESMHLKLTGGADGDYINIPDCSGEEYFKDHHLLFTADDPKDTKIAMWFNDDTQEMYASHDGTYKGGYSLPNYDGQINIFLGMGGNDVNAVSEAGTDAGGTARSTASSAAQRGIAITVAAK